MKRLLLCAFLFFGLQSFAGGFRFPNIDFAYAKLYLFNLKLDQPSHMDFYIYKEGVYAKSKLGNGHVLSPHFHSTLQDALKHGVDELNWGLSKCYMPRHGIIYFNKKDEPVASLSICFECDKISVWSKRPYNFNEDYTKFNYDKAEKQLKEMKELIKAEGIPVYDHPDDLDKYLAHADLDTTFSINGKGVLKIKDEEKFLAKTISSERVKTWLASYSRDQFYERQDSLLNEDGTVTICTALKLNKESRLLLVQDCLIYGEINDNSILLPAGLSIGMSSIDVYHALGYPIPENKFPQEIQVIGKYWKYTLYFSYHTVEKITLEPV